MAIRRLERAEWAAFCARASRGYLGKQVEVEVLSAEIGCQVQVHGLPLIGLSYDPKDDLIELFVGELSHFIRTPRRFYVDEDPLGDVSFHVIDVDDTRCIITLHEPLMLPAPGHDGHWPP